MNDEVQSGPQRTRWLTLALVSVPILFAWWVIAVPWVGGFAGAIGMGGYLSLVILELFLMPLLVGFLSAWWTGRRKSPGRGLFICAGAGFLTALISDVGYAVIVAAFVNPGMPFDFSLRPDALVILGLIGAVFGGLGGVVFLALARLAGGHGRAKVRPESGVH